MKRRLGRRDEGTSLLIVLIIVTVVSSVIGVGLSHADTSVRTTVVLRDQTSKNYASDGAAQAIVTQLQNGKLSCSSTTDSTVPALGSGTATPFYTPVQTKDGPLNASATCAPDPASNTPIATTTTVGTGVDVNSANQPTYALLTVGTNTASTEGLNVAGNKVICINGGSVASNSFIVVGNQGAANVLAVGINSSPTLCTVQADPSITVTAAAPLGCNNAVTNSNIDDFQPTPCGHSPAPLPVGTWGTFAPVPTAAIPANRVNPDALCTTIGGTRYAALLPGLYTNPPGSTTLMNVQNPCKNGSTYSAADVEWLTPGSSSAGGTYYFNYGSTTWRWPLTFLTGTPVDGLTKKLILPLVGFDASDTTAANKAKLGNLSAVTSFPGGCAGPNQPYDAAGNPVTTSPGTTQPGTELVFGGASTFTPQTANSNAVGKNEICATYSATAPPVAIYGVSKDVNPGGLSISGQIIPPQTLCTTTPCTAASVGGTSLVGTDGNGQTSFFVEGFTFAPSAPVHLDFQNSAGQVFGWGLVLRTISMIVNGVTSSQPFIVVRPTIHQGFVTTTTYTDSFSIRYVNVWTCPASTTACPQSGPPNVRVKVQTTGTTVKVLSWSEQR